MSSEDPNGRAELSALLEAISTKYGLDLRGYAPNSLQRRAMFALAKSGLSTLAALQERVVDDADFFADVLHDLTVHVSELFRDPGLYRVFRAQVVPLLRTYPQIRIWHAGCATGEEAYASAILLTEEGLYERTQIYATDVSSKAVARAAEGIYSIEQFRLFTENHRQSGGRSTLASYFNVAHGRVVAKQALRRNILFFQHNLVSDDSFAEMHVVFCRNVLMYFGPALRERVTEVLTRSLCNGAFLCLGSGEHITPGGRRPHFQELRDAPRIYRYSGSL